ncbi:MAG: Icc protein [Roseivirga sp.]|jgi:Icc protein
MTRRIAYLTDIHLDEEFPAENGVNSKENWGLILSDVRSRGIDEIYFGGDIGSQAINAWFFDSLKDFKINLVLGNHDHFSETHKHLKGISSHSSTELYYALEDQRYKYVFLDSSSGTISKPQYEWFCEEINTKKPLLMFIHHPILPIEVKVDELYGLTNRDKIVEQLDQLQHDVTVFCGHYHMNDIRTTGRIRQIVTPACSYQAEKNPLEIRVNNASFGYRIIDLTAHSLETYLIKYEHGHFQLQAKD